jgi:tetratricopeptide (TPR) repeat protein
MFRIAVRACAIAVGLLLLHHLVWLPAQCNRTLRSVEARTRFTMGKVASVEIPAARENIRELESIAPGCENDVNLYMLLAANKRTVGRIDEAIRDLTNLLRIADRPEIYLTRGLLHMEAGNLAAAENDLVTAVELRPGYLGELHGELRNRISKTIADRRTRRARD